MCRYKTLKYQDYDDKSKSNKSDEEHLLRPEDSRGSSAEEWISVDSELNQAISYYYDLKTDVNGYK
jgi:hypothetical protein